MKHKKHSKLMAHMVRIEDGKIKIDGEGIDGTNDFEFTPVGAASFLIAIHHMTNGDMLFYAHSSIDFPEDYGLPSFVINDWMESGHKYLDNFPKVLAEWKKNRG